MAKKSAVEKNKRRMRIVAAKGARRDILRAIMRDKSISMEDRFAASCKLAQEPRDSARSRVRNRCLVTGRPRGYYRKLRCSEVKLVRRRDCNVYE